MSEIKDGGTAFQHWDEKTLKFCGGLSKREWFAGVALVGIANTSEHFPETAATWAYKYADAMIKAGEGKK